VMAHFKAAPPPSVHPATLDRETIARVMSSINRRVQLCYDTTMVPGQVDLVLTVEPSGRVQHASVSADSSTATCIRQLAHTLRFPPFAAEPITIRYPYSFR